MEREREKEVEKVGKGRRDMEGGKMVKRENEVVGG